jgi:membrane complex biogenesis BtpA family protein
MPPAWKRRLDALQISSLADIFRTAKPIIGMVHCWPMPGAPGYNGYGMQTIIDHAVADAKALIAHIPPESIAAHAVVAAAIRAVCPLPMGINLVHNGGVALLGIALAARADFIRVCMFTGAGVWDAGSIDEGCAADLMRRRSELHAEHIKILADVDKKHSVRFPGIDLATHIEWTRFFGADALIISGRMTGDAPDVAKVREAKQLAGDRPIIIGSGADARNIAAFMQVADGVIVGSSIKYAGDIAEPVDEARVRQFVAAARGAS